MKTQLMLYGLLLMGLIGCKCEGTSSTTIVIKNESKVNISVVSYINGVPDNEIMIKKDSLKEITEFYTRGKYVDGPAYLQSRDSIVITFNGTKKMLQYGFYNSGKNPKAVLLTSNRNLYVIDNYVQKIVAEDKCYLGTELTFTFTEQDFLNAK